MNKKKIRQIRIRGWDAQENRMIDLSKTLHDAESIIITHDILLGKSKRFIPMQSTGVKDKNGKEIFDGDIVKSELEDGEFTYDSISWSDKFLGWENNGIGLHELMETVDFAVVGNIYENPELLKEVK